MLPPDLNTSALHQPWMIYASCLRVHVRISCFVVIYFIIQSFKKISLNFVSGKATLENRGTGFNLDNKDIFILFFHTSKGIAKLWGL